MTLSKVVHSHNSDEWPTPQAFFDMLDVEFDFTLDPCATDDNAKCDLYYTQADNGLVQNWGQHTVFVNPPYSQAIAWIKKSVQATRKGATVVMLMASRTGTDWFCDHALPNVHEIRFVRGRLKFEGGKSGAPFDSVVLVFRPEIRENPTISTVGRNWAETQQRAQLTWRLAR